LADAQRHGVRVARPHVNHSRAGASLEGDREAPVVRLGLDSVRGVGADLAATLAAGAPWSSPEDLVRRARCQHQHLEALAAAGALDGFAPSRRAMLWSAGAAAQATPERLPGIVTGLVAPPLASPSALEQVADDLWSMGVTPEGTAMTVMRERLEARGVVRAGTLAGAESDRVTVAGVVTHRQHPETARGAVFLNLEDETGHVNVIFSRGAWARWRDVARYAPALVVRGRLERGQGTLGLVAEFVEPLDLSAPSPPSRDFR
jgi:error-prone DNA polymerase